MEFLIVRFDEDRQVLIDGNMNGKTNETLQLEAGTHKVSLKSPPSDFFPEDQEIVLEGTNALDPEEVKFEKI